MSDAQNYFATRDGVNCVNFGWDSVAKNASKDSVHFVHFARK